MLTVKLEKRVGNWSYRGFRIVKLKWCCPTTCTSYRLLDDDGEAILDCDTLSDMRDYLSGMLEDETWEATLEHLRKDRPGI